MAFLRRIWNKWQNLLHDEKLKHKIYVIIFESDTYGAQNEAYKTIY